VEEDLRRIAPKRLRCIGWLHRCGGGGLAQDRAQAVALYRLAAAQNFDGAQNSLGFMYYHGMGVAKDFAKDFAENDAEALRWHQLAAAQGNAWAMYWVALCIEKGRGVPKNKAEAIRWHRRAQAAGCSDAANAVRRLGV